MSVITNWTSVLFILVTCGCTGTSEVITADATELVLSIEDVGEGWESMNGEWVDDETYSVLFMSDQPSSENQSIERYDLLNSVVVYPNSTAAKAAYEDMKVSARLSALHQEKGIRDINLGDEAFMGYGAGLGGVVMREKNVVAMLTVYDNSEGLTEVFLMRYAVIQDEKIKIIK